MGLIEKLLLKIGFVAFLAGILLFFMRKLGLNPGKLPGDIHISKEAFEFWLPITTCTIISIAVSGGLWLWNLIEKLLK